MRYRLRTLMIVLAIGPPVIAVVWYFAGVAHARRVAAFHYRKSIEAVERIAIAAQQSREVEVELTAEGLKAFEIHRMAEEAQYEENSRLYKLHKARAAEYKKAAFTPWSFPIRP